MIASISTMLGIVRRSVQTMTPTERISVRNELDRKLGGRRMFIPSMNWNCSCGNRQKMFFNPARSRMLRCPSCDLAEVLDWLELPTQHILQQLDREFLSWCGILQADPEAIPERDRQFLLDCGIRPE